MLGTPPAVLALLALGLLLGRPWPAPIVPALGCLLAGLVVGAAIGGDAGAGQAAPALYCVALLAGGLAAVRLSDPAPVPATLAGAAGVAAGLSLTPTHGSFPALAAAVTGAALSAILAVAILAALSAAADRAPLRAAGVAVRVAAAWLVAIAALMLALAVAGATA